VTSQDEKLVGSIDGVGALSMLEWIDSVMVSALDLIIEAGIVVIDCVDISGSVEAVLFD